MRPLRKVSLPARHRSAALSLITQAGFFVVARNGWLEKIYGWFFG